MIRTLIKLNKITASATPSATPSATFSATASATPSMDIINTIKSVLETNNSLLIENKFSKRQNNISFIHISKTELENNQEFKEIQKKFTNINIKFYPSMFNDKYGVQYFPKDKQIDIYID